MANIASHTWQVFIIDNGGNGGGSRGRNEKDIYLVYRPSVLVETITIRKLSCSSMVLVVQSSQ